LAGRNGVDQLARLPDAEIAAALLLLDEKQQGTMLEFTSPRITAPSMTGPLEAILDKPKISDLSLRVTALHALLKVNPERGRARLLAEIRKPHADNFTNARSMAWCLSALPDETLPELDELLADRLEHSDSPTRDLDAQLIGRYATSAIFGHVKAILLNEADSWSCTAADGLMRYFLRFDQKYGLSLFAAHGGSCSIQSLNEVARLKLWPEVEPVFLRRLNDADLWHARDAVEVLGERGDANAKQALLVRLRAFHEEWKGRAGEFRHGLGATRDVDAAMSLQSGLIQSLHQAKGWILSKEEDAEVESLTLRGER
jgi:HEAT repeat protein